MNIEIIIPTFFIWLLPVCFGMPTENSSSGEALGKIMGGLTANRGEFPYQALVMRDGYSCCGASILSKKFILSAAHCVETKGIVDSASRYKIAVGVHDRASLAERNVQNLTVKNIIMHENYKNETYQNDIAILELHNEIQFNNYVKSVKLAGSNEDFTGNVIVSGWGRNDGKETILQKLTAPLVSNDKCNSRWSSSNTTITSEMLCFREEGRDACRGDSGSPMMCRRSDNTLVQCGIVSFGKSCKTSWLPGVQTRVSSYISWIEEKTDIGNSLKQKMDQAEPLTTKSAEFVLKLAYEVKQANDLNLKYRFPKSIQDLIWHSACRIKNVETGHFIKVVMEEQIISNGNTIQVYHVVGEDASPISPNWILIPEIRKNKLRFRIHNKNIGKYMNDERDEGFVQDLASALQYEVHFENDRVPSGMAQQPFYIFSPGKNVYFHEARRSWEPWRCGFNQLLDCLVSSEPGSKYNEGKFILEGCVEEVGFVGGMRDDTEADGCLKKGTNILMADMTQKPVEELKAGDLVMDMDFKPAKVIGVSFEFLFNQQFYGFGEDSAFFTQSHMFVGPKDDNQLQFYAFNTSNLIHFNPLMQYLNFTKMVQENTSRVFKIGNKMNKTASPLSVFKDSTVYPRDTRIYSVQVDNPTGTYFANGYLCRHDIPPMEYWPNTMGLLSRLLNTTNFRLASEIPFTIETDGFLDEVTEKVKFSVEKYLSNLTLIGNEDVPVMNLDGNLDESIKALFANPSITALGLKLYAKLGPLLAPHLDCAVFNDKTCGIGNYIGFLQRDLLSLINKKLLVLKRFDNSEHL